SAPTRVTAPAIGLTADLVPLGLLADGTLEVPDDPHVPGWYTGGPAPGDPGPAVIAGHVDSQTGPAVFFRLPQLRRGDEVGVGQADGTEVLFRVDRVERHPKDRFPTAAVYGPVPAAELRLITCGGEFDRRSSHYVDNVVVFATRVGAAAPG
ncbi:MAG: class F sortase, partial [Actinomycetota bacterium]|nr:class F sortase [Actinomycetota bacterium]